MVGKHGQRTKNNARPSSSGLSAEQLNYLGPGNMAALHHTFAATTYELPSNRELALCFKKLTKKDPITRTKALQELADRAPECKQDDIVEALPNWAQSFCTLSQDPDNKVREATQICHGAMAAACGKYLARHLKSMSAAWLVAAHDDHAPTSSRARNSLENTFPNNKLGEMLGFVLDKAAPTLGSMLTSPQGAVVSKKINDPEERYVVHVRLVGGALRALAELAERLPDAEGLEDRLRASMKPVVESGAFWKLALHHESRLRAAWYLCLGALVSRIGAASSGGALRAARALLSADEQDGSAAKALWVALLRLMQRTEEWPEWSSMKELLLKRLMQLLLDGDAGPTLGTEELMLPLLGSLPAELRTEAVYRQFVESALVGLERPPLRHALTSRGPCAGGGEQRWLRAIFHCLEHLALGSADREPVPATLAADFLCETLRAVLRPTNLSLARTAGDQIVHLLSQPTASEELVGEIVRRTRTELLSQLEDPAYATPAVVNIHVQLIKAMRTSLLYGPRRRLAIKFQDEAPAAANAREEDECPEVAARRLRIERVLMENSAEPLAAKYMALLETEWADEDRMEALVDLLRDLESPGLYVRLAAHLEMESVREMCERLVVPRVVRMGVASTVAPAAEPAGANNDAAAPDVVANGDVLNAVGDAEPDNPGGEAAADNPGDEAPAVGAPADNPDVGEPAYPDDVAPADNPAVAAPAIPAVGAPANPDDEAPADSAEDEDVDIESIAGTERIAEHAGPAPIEYGLLDIAAGGASEEVPYVPLRDDQSEASDKGPSDRSGEAAANEDRAPPPDDGPSAAADANTDNSPDEGPADGAPAAVACPARIAIVQVPIGEYVLFTDSSDDESGDDGDDTDDDVPIPEVQPQPQAQPPPPPQPQPQPQVQPPPLEEDAEPSDEEPDYLPYVRNAPTPPGVDPVIPSPPTNVRKPSFKTVSLPTAMAALDLLFLFLPHLDAEDQYEMMASLNQVSEYVLVGALRRCALQRELPAARRFGRGPLAVQAAAAATRAALRRDPNARTTLLMAFTADDQHGEMLVGPETVEKVVHIVGLGMLRDSLVVAPLASVVTTHLSTSPMPEAVESLVGHLFAFLIKYPVEHCKLAHWMEGSMDGACTVSDLWHEARCACLNGIQAMPTQDSRRKLLDKLVNIQHTELDRTVELNVRDLELCAGLWSFFLAKSNVQEISSISHRVFSWLSARYLEPAKMEQLAVRYGMASGYLHCAISSDLRMRRAIRLVKLPSREILIRDSRSRLLRAFHLRGIFAPTKVQVYCTTYSADNLLTCRHLAAEVLGMLHDWAVSWAMCDGYAFAPNYDIFRTYRAGMSRAAADVMGSLGKECREQLELQLRHKGQIYGYHWAEAAARYPELFNNFAGGPPPLTEVVTDDEASGNGTIHTLQMSLRFWRPTGETAEEDYKVMEVGVAYIVMVRAWLLTSNRSEFVFQVSPCVNNQDPTPIFDWCLRDEEMLRSPVDLSTKPWADMQAYTSFAEYLATVVNCKGWDADERHWNMAAITLSWLLTCIEASLESWHNVKVAMVIRATVHLYIAIARFVPTIRQHCIRQQPAAHIAALPDEWRDVVAPAVHGPLLALAAHVIGQAERREQPEAARAVVLQVLVTAVPLIEWQNCPPPADLVKLAQCTVACLADCVHPGYKMVAGRLLHLLAIPLVLDDVRKVTAWNALATNAAGSCAGARPPLAFSYLEPDLERLLDLLNVALSIYKVGLDTCEMEPLSDSQSLALGAMLLGGALCRVARLHRSEPTHHYIDMLSQSAVTEMLLKCALRLVPSAVADTAMEGAPAAAATRRATDAQLDLFRNEPEFSLFEASHGGVNSISAVAAAACHALFSLLDGPGAPAARGAWTAMEGRGARFAGALVARYISPVIVRRQLQAVLDLAPELTNAQVRVSWDEREAWCAVPVDDRTVDVCVRLAENHPLAAPQVTRAPFTPAPMPAHLVLYLAYQNGTVAQALRMWVETVTARVEATPQCYICYCRLHPSSGRTPQVPCHQCGNRFHQICLRKWFVTSNKSTCPICRSTF